MLCTPSTFSQQFSRDHSRLASILRDAETAAGLAASGKLLYDAHKQDWKQYCSNAVALANRGEFRQSVREASKALFLGESSNNTTALAFASRDLAYAYSLAGDLDAAEQWAKHSLAHLARSRVRDQGAVLVPVQKVLGDIAARRGDPEAALKYYERALGTSYLADPLRLPLSLAIANTEIRRGNPNAARRILNDIGSDEPR
jgi:tetratricopeptide (TPR) repeat protein